jgi:hypothetical protein
MSLLLLFAQDKSTPEVVEASYSQREHIVYDNIWDSDIGAVLSSLDLCYLETSTAHEPDSITAQGRAIRMIQYAITTIVTTQDVYSYDIDVTGEGRDWREHEADAAVIVLQTLGSLLSHSLPHVRIWANGLVVVILVHPSVPGSAFHAALQQGGVLPTLSLRLSGSHEAGILEMA